MFTLFDRYCTTIFQLWRHQRCSALPVLFYVTTFSLWNESLNSDGQRFHQYQQNEHSLLTLTRKTKQITTYNVGNPSPSLRQEQNYGDVEPINEIQPLLLANWISNGNTYINTICFHLKRPHTVTNVNANITMDSTIAGSMYAHS